MSKSYRFYLYVWVLTQGVNVTYAERSAAAVLGLLDLLLLLFIVISFGKLYALSAVLAGQKAWTHQAHARQSSV